MSISTVTWIPPDKADLVIITERAASALSTAGCLFVFVTFACSKRLRRPVNRLLFYATIANLGMDAGTFIAFSGMYAGQDSLLCQIQGFLIQMFLPTDVLWNLAMAINTYLTVFKGYDAQRLRKLEWVYNLFNFGLPFGVALGYCFLSTQSRGKIYGPAILWCWVSDPWDVFRIALCYGPVWIGILGCTLIYLAAGVSIFRKRNQLRQFRYGSKRGGMASSLALSFFPDSINRTTEVRTTSTMRDDDSEEKILATGQYQCSAEALPKNPFAESDIQAHSQNPAMVANAAAWGYTKAAMLFFVCLLITWVPSSVFRVFSVLHPDVHSFPLAYTAAIVLPLQGFWNAIIYVIISWDAFKLWIKEDLRGGGNSSNSPNLVDTKSVLSPMGTIREKDNSSDGLNSTINGSTKSPEGKPDAFESLYGMTGTGTPKLPPIGHRSQSSLGLNDRASFDYPLGEQRFSRSTSVRSARNTSNSFDPASTGRPMRYGSTRMPRASSIGGRPPSIEERPGTAPEMLRPQDNDFDHHKIDGLVELPTAITPRVPSSPSPP